MGDLNYGGEFIVWDILFGIFYNLKGYWLKDEIGIGKVFNYLMMWVGLMIVLFLFN